MCGVCPYMTDEARLHSVTLTTQETGDMNIPVWLMWVIAVTLASMPMCVLLIRKGEAGVDGSSEISGEEDNPDKDEHTDETLHTIVKGMARVQMRQMWGKDIDHIV